MWPKTTGATSKANRLPNTTRRSRDARRCMEPPLPLTRSRKHRRRDKLCLLAMPIFAASQGMKAIDVLRQGLFGSEYWLARFAFQRGLALIYLVAFLRSEERRVGKECSSRWGR